MKKVVVCIGSSCHLKGARQIIELWQAMVKENNITEDVELSGTFCMGKCENDGVSVKVDDVYYAVKPEEASDFFNNIIKKELLN